MEHPRRGASLPSRDPPAAVPLEGEAVIDNPVVNGSLLCWATRCRKKPQRAHASFSSVPAARKRAGALPAAPGPLPLVSPSPGAMSSCSRRCQTGPRLPEHPTHPLQAPGAAPPRRPLPPGTAPPRCPARCPVAMLGRCARVTAAWTVRRGRRRGTRWWHRERQAAATAVQRGA